MHARIDVQMQPAAALVRQMILQDIFDEWVRAKAPGCNTSLASKMRKREATCPNLLACSGFANAEGNVNACTAQLQSQGHDALEPFEFMSEEAVEEAFDVIAALLSSFGTKIPNPCKFKVSCCKAEG